MQILWNETTHQWQQQRPTTSIWLEWAALAADTANGNAIKASMNDLEDEEDDENERGNDYDPNQPSSLSSPLS